MITIEITAPCPKCRIAIDSWDIKWSKAKITLKRRGLWPANQNILHDPVIATSKCKSCKNTVSQVVVLRIAKDKEPIEVIDLIPEKTP